MMQVLGFLAALIGLGLTVNAAKATTTPPNNTEYPCYLLLELNPFGYELPITIGLDWGDLVEIHPEGAPNAGEDELVAGKERRQFSLQTHIINGTERIPVLATVTMIEGAIDGPLHQIDLDLSHFGAEMSLIAGHSGAGGERSLSGTYTKDRGWYETRSMSVTGQTSSYRFWDRSSFDDGLKPPGMRIEKQETQAQRALSHRDPFTHLGFGGLKLPSTRALKAIPGRWTVQFEDADDPAVGIFEVDQDTGVTTGTFLTTTGDYRYLEGIIEGDKLKLSCFDGGHAFLFKATLLEDGTLSGDFFSGNWYHTNWTARPRTAEDEANTPDPFKLTTLNDSVDLSGLAYLDLQGNPQTIGDAIRAQGTAARTGPAIIELFGSWCPNCHDAAVAIKQLKSEYSDQGLAVVGLAFELIEDHRSAAVRVGTYTKRHDIDWPILIAGVADKALATKQFRAIDKIRAYPTTIFLNADGSVEAIFTGFTGPAAPTEHEAMMTQWRETIDRMLRKAHTNGR